MGWWRLGFARRGPQHRPARRPGGGQEPRHAGRGRTVGVRRGALVQATRPLGHGGDAAARIRRDGAARCRRGSGARGGAAATGGPAARRRPRVRRRGPPRCPARGAAPVRAHASDGPRRAARVRVRGGAPGGARRVRGRAAAGAARPDRAGARHARRARDPGRRGLRVVRHRVHGAAAAARRVRGRHAPRVVPRDRRRGVRVAGRPARSAPPLMPTPLLDGFDFAALTDALAALGVDGWLVYDFRKVNPIAERILGPTGMGTRRLFVLLPRSGRPVAIAHRIELQPLADFPGEVRPYGSWHELHAELQALARGRTLAMEVSPQDAVPYLDRVPHGVVQLLEGFGARIVSSAPLVTRFAARWSAGEADGHRRAAQALAEIAPEALAWAGRETARGAEVREAGLQRRVVEAIERAGLVADHPPIAAFGPNSAMPHYEPRAGADRRLEAGQVVLLDLWAGPTLSSVFADQTWMGFSGRTPDTEVRKVWQTVRGARDAAVSLLRDRWATGKGKRERGNVTGAAVDDAARDVIRAAGYAEYFVHRTGHSIDRDLHGSGPHIDNFETADERPLVPGVGFSIEPGIYLPGRFGMRSEINVFMNETGPEVTPGAPQQELLLV